MCGIIIKTTASKLKEIYAKMKGTIFLVIMVLMTLAESASFSYKRQDQWQGICWRQYRPSVTNQHRHNEGERKLAPLEFN